MVRDMLGDAAQWSVDTHLLAYIADGIWAGVWQRGSGKKSDKPKPIPRPGDVEPEQTKYAPKSRTIAELDAFFKKAREGGEDLSVSSSQRLT